MRHLAHLTLTIAFGVLSAAATAQGADTTPAKPAAKPAPRPATQREALKSEAKGLALASETSEIISANQLGVAARVLTGKAYCEYNQSVDVNAINEHPGMFRVRFKNVSYVMVPEETTTGAVRLADKQAGVVWLQIPAKSMLLNDREGQRMVDRCTQAAQRTAMAAATAGAKSSTPVDPRK